MSSLTTTTINTANGTTNLTAMTGNVSSASIVVRTDGIVNIRANSSVNTITVNTTNITTNTASFTANGNMSVTGTLTAIGNSTLSGNTTVAASLTVANVLTISNSAVFTTNSVTMGASLLASNGYSRLPNGLLMQWGKVTVNSTSGTITFPAAFSAVYSVTTTSNANTHLNMAAVTAVTTTTATVRSANTANPASATAYWMAIGS